MVKGPTTARSGRDGDGDSPVHILRFLRSERFLHWALAAPFVLLYGTALLMILFWSEPQPRQIRTIFAWIHRIVGVCLIVFPPIVLFRGRSEWRTHLANMKEGWKWSRDDLRWLILFPRAALDSRIHLPDQGKFNAAEKLNFMMVSTAYPLYIVTGLLIWLPGVGFLPWLAHCTMAALGLPLVVGHIVMATVNPGTRIGLSGMVTGWVDREWARHHYRRWYRERFENPESAAEAETAATLVYQQAIIRCSYCRHPHTFESWEQLLQRMFQVEPLFCEGCGGELGITDAQATPEMADHLMRHLEQGSAAAALAESLPDPGIDAGELAPLPRSGGVFVDAR